MRKKLSAWSSNSKVTQFSLSLSFLISFSEYNSIPKNTWHINLLLTEEILGSLGIFGKEKSLSESFGITRKWDQEGNLVGWNFQRSVLIIFMKYLGKRVVLKKTCINRCVYVCVLIKIWILSNWKTTCKMQKISYKLQICNYKYVICLLPTSSLWFCASPLIHSVPAILVSIQF